MPQTGKCESGGGEHARHWNRTAFHAMLERRVCQIRAMLPLCQKGEALLGDVSVPTAQLPGAATDVRQCCQRGGSTADRRPKG